MKLVCRAQLSQSSNYLPYVSKIIALKKKDKIKGGNGKEIITCKQTKAQIESHYILHIRY